ncbi:hypothetical protein COLO4_36590 [Corchorus olitorius]|uniref:Uncharacterized protein n=1 Tax=Corchorus olitorius TaxID=93759 RepID=A0A1R3G7P2_9ROSI|nr:hypothetical protein COLO4_36590 [Corchorus olitorius]
MSAVVGMINLKRKLCTFPVKIKTIAIHASVKWT